MTGIRERQLTLGASYQTVYELLGELRESFHRFGRLDDSNAKLDEIAKIFASYVAFKNGEISAFPAPKSPRIVKDLQEAFSKTAKLPRYSTATFGVNPSLAIRTGDERLAAELVELVTSCVDIAYHQKTARQSFDILNEGFGHFVRDNFRGNIEDAQYLTPPEVVDFMVDLALTDIAQNSDRVPIGAQMTVLDPTCGVGSFLAAIYSRAKHSEWINVRNLRLFGQDKVERMVRLSSVNLELFDVQEHRITLGNSLAIGSPIDHLNDQVDLILTNPPFGARYSSDDVVNCFGNNTPFFSKIRRQSTAVTSELLFVDRNLRMLKPGGRLLIVVPDGVISAKGMAAMLRQHLLNTVAVRAIVELPSVTFAQAGTRTKTAILFLQRMAQHSDRKVFMAVSSDLGFQVSTRKGVQVKTIAGTNDLPKIISYYDGINAPAQSSVKRPLLVSTSPSVVLLPAEAIRSGSWTPQHYHASRFNSVSAIKKSRSFELIPLRKLVEFVSNERKAIRHTSGTAFISVLHVLGEGFLDIGGIHNYSPKTPGVETKPGEILFSRINPRIPRVCVVPDLGRKTICSSEFEVMKPTNGTDPHEIVFLLQTQIVQAQIKSLTSGTSASHNRIRTSELGDVQVPLPKNGTQQRRHFRRIISNYAEAMNNVVINTDKLAKIRSEEERFFKG